MRAFPHELPPTTLLPRGSEHYFSIEAVELRRQFRLLQHFALVPARKKASAAWHLFWGTRSADAAEADFSKLNEWLPDARELQDYLEQVRDLLAGAEILMTYLVRYALRKNEHKRPGGNLARATYSAYNGGPGHLTRYRAAKPVAQLKKVDHAFWQKFQAVKSGQELPVKSCYGQ